MFERFTRDDRMLMGFAMQEAGDLGHRQLGNDHLILGMLCNARSPLFGLLAEQGLTLANARETVRAYHAERDTAEPDAADDDAQESAQQRYSEDREALRSIGIDLDKLRDAVRSRFGDDLTEGWGDRGGRPHGRGRGRGPGGRGEGGRGEGGRGHGGHGGRGHGGGRGRGHGPHRGSRPDCGPEGFRSAGRGFGPEGFGPGGPGARPDGFGPEGFGPGGFGPEGFGGPWEPGRGRRGPRGRGSRPRFAGVTRDAFGAAVKIARERGDSQLRPEFLLLGILEVGDAASRAVIESATTVDDLKAAVLASLPEVDAPDAGAEV